ncbi:gas vesicle protein GvpO [Pseudonocardia pini]|uniref:gas vesicle protein GvpO n=1 Tax=Pseudonocardia pini TaxID=2758030 RepID=UPI0028AF0E1B|nr:gas vesicle protein GvpO [Pseudonocardia pini]
MTDDVADDVADGDAPDTDDGRPARRRRPTREDPGAGAAPARRARRAKPKQPEPAENGHREGSRRKKLPVVAARQAAEQLVTLVGRELESVVSIESSGDDGWVVGVEVVETRRIPDSADILALFEVQIDADGDLTGYRRTARYGRGTMNKGGR